MKFIFQKAGVGWTIKKGPYSLYKTSRYYISIRFLLGRNR